MINYLPSSKHQKSLNLLYLGLSEDVKTMLAKATASKYLKLSKDNVDFSSSTSTKSLSTSLNALSNDFGNSNYNRLINSAHEEHLSNKYESTPSRVSAYKNFINHINKNDDWLSNTVSSDFKYKANKFIIEENERIRLIEEELDDVNKYVGVVGEYYIDEQVGDDLNWLQSIWSVNVSTENRNVFISGTVKNYGAKSKRILLKGNVNIRTKSKAWYGSSNKKSYISGNYYVDLSPGGSEQFVIMASYTSKARNDSHILWGENSYSVFVDRDEPVEFEFEYSDGSVSTSTLDFQNKLKNSYIQTGNITTKETMWKNEYQRSDYNTRDEIRFDIGDWENNGIFSSGIHTDADKGKEVSFQCPMDSKKPGAYISEYIGLKRNGKFVTGINVCTFIFGSEPTFDTFEAAKWKTVECMCY